MGRRENSGDIFLCFPLLDVIRFKIFHDHIEISRLKSYACGCAVVGRKETGIHQRLWEIRTILHDGEQNVRDTN